MAYRACPTFPAAHPAHCGYAPRLPCLLPFPDISEALPSNGYQAVNPYSNPGMLALEMGSLPSWYSTESKNPSLSVSSRPSSTTVTEKSSSYEISIGVGCPNSNWKCGNRFSVQSDQRLQGTIGLNLKDSVTRRLGVSEAPFAGKVGLDPPSGSFRRIIEYNQFRNLNICKITSSLSLFPIEAISATLVGEDASELPALWLVPVRCRKIERLDNLSLLVEPKPVVRHY